MGIEPATSLDDATGGDASDPGADAHAAHGMRELIAQDWHAALAALAWQVECGVDVDILDAPLDRYALHAEALETAAKAPPAAPVAPRAAPVPRRAAAPDPEPGPRALSDAERLAEAVAAAEAHAGRATTPEALRAAIEAFDGCELKRGARGTVLPQLRAGVRLLVVGDAPDREEEQAARPFAGGAGLLLDRMFAAIGLARDAVDAERGLNLATALPWRPPGNRPPESDELAIMRPFLHGAIAVSGAEIVVAMGNDALLMLTGQSGIAGARGRWLEGPGVPVLAMTHPRHLLRNPMLKRDAWGDLLRLQARLEGGGT